ncbi:hypothetical protein [Photobacterium alginatilyticum]|uniref:Uncharacterized protein n=1 Tax=Photobacterium alginatilyticum TaxID=1775171 RepID=A0ABW9YLP9_9GAMM|nr:hypothetical protein [Photobacterium alginatilyticum]NBI54310.1 hypothetical protein [Photobacterium alginatilyticum]
MVGKWLCCFIAVIGMLPVTGWAAKCDLASGAQVTLIYLEDYAKGSSAGQIVKQKVDYLKGIMASSAFEERSAVNVSLSYYADSDSEEQLVITLSSEYLGSYDAMTELMNSKGHVSIDISQCQP